MMTDAAPAPLVAARSPRAMSTLIDGVDVMRWTVARWWRGADRRRAAPPCRPIRAHHDLGPPLTAGPARPAAVAAWMSPPPERQLPRDLNLPLSAFDPGAIPAAPPAVAPMRMPAAGMADPMMLERTLQRLRTLTGHA